MNCVIEAVRRQVSITHRATRSLNRHGLTLSRCAHKAHLDLNVLGRLSLEVHSSYLGDHLANEVRLIADDGIGGRRLEV